MKLKYLYRCVAVFKNNIMILYVSTTFYVDIFSIYNTYVYNT